jgi:hypothetical protein
LAGALGLGLAPAPASALTLNASLLVGGSSLGGAATSQSGADAAAPMLGGELTVDLSTYVQAGVFYDHDFASYSDASSGSLRFYGALLRVGLMGPGSNLYADTHLGVSQRLGIGYRIWVLPYLDLSPRLGIRILPEPYQGSTYSSTALDGGVLLTFEF